MHDHYTKEQKEHYQKLCRKDIEPTAKQAASLKCRYISNNSPFLKIGPIKMEEIHLNPDIFIFHDALYEKEIKVLQHIAISRVINSKNKTLIFVS